ncbi:MAG: SDR family NAD(P)-dependent oxidoreductase [bacterium]|nr:SDR family NAD(P)-dependent oxidoreductase [bacterium]
MESVAQLRPATLIVGPSGDLLDVARILGRRGEVIGLLSRDAARLQTFKDRLLGWGVDADLFLADVTDSSQVLDAFMRFSGWSKRLDRMIYNVGVLSNEPASEVTQTELSRAMAANFFGFVNCFQLALPMFQRLNRGHVVSISGAPALELDSSPVAYATSKASLKIYLQALRRELSDNGIRFSELYLGQMQDGYDVRELRCEEVVSGVLQVLVSQADRMLVGNTRTT